jgi:ribonuclease E
MESSKNQREVEDRLRDAMKMDRARIQIGRLSRFGLLEMSRQRLRPSLGESSHIVCPRCVGIGSIRSVESMTLAVLRLIGEELRKDRTARVIAQVPVSVATYLINEKREWLRTLEDKSEAELIIVPNENIQTPEYSIKRVRHDEMELPEQRQATYLMPSTPEIAEPGAQDRKPPQEAPAVSPLLPSTSAPSPAHHATAPPAAGVTSAQGSFWTRFKRMLAGEPASPPVPERAPEASAAPAARAPRRDEGQRRDGRRDHARHGRYADGPRRDRDGRRDGRDRDRSREHGDRDRGRDRDRSRRQEPLAERGGERAERATDRSGTERNGDRNADRSSSVEAPRQELTGTAPLGSASQDGRPERPDGRSRGRRGRRRGRRGGGGGREGVASTGANDVTSLESAAPAASASGNGQENMPAQHAAGEAPAPAQVVRPDVPERVERDFHAEPREPGSSHEPSSSREPGSSHESVPLAHYEPSPKPEPGSAPNKPYVVWSSAPSQKDAGNRGPEE